MGLRTRWLLLLVVALLWRGMAVALPSPLPAPTTATALALASVAHGGHPAALDATASNAAPGPNGDGHASAECKLACDLLLSPALLPPATQAASAALPVQVPVVPQLLWRDAGPPDRPPPIR